MTKNSTPLHLYTSTPRILVTGGGTGGHIMPLEAIVEELKKEDTQLLYVGSNMDLEKDMARRQKIDYRSIFCGKYRRYFSWENLIDPFKIFFGFLQSLGIILSFKPDIIFAKGGYVTIPVIFAGWLFGKKIVTHESDAVMGLANKMAINKVTKIYVGFPVEYYQDVPLDKIIYTGNPVRREFFSPIAKNHLPLAISHKPVILVTGGSQGSRYINQTIASILAELTKEYEIVHISGKNDYEWLAKNSWPNYQLYDFTDKIPELMKKADLIISRAGANTIAELAILKKPSILIPLTSAASDHQTINAKILEKNNAAVVLTEKNLSPESLLDIINCIVKDKTLQNALSKQIAEFAQPEAAKLIKEEIFKLLRSKDDSQVSGR